MARNTIFGIWFLLCMVLFLSFMCAPASAQSDRGVSADSEEYTSAPAASGPPPVLYRKTTESLLEVRVTTAKTFLNQADTALMKGNHAMTRIYLSKSQTEFNRFKNLFPTTIIVQNIERAQAAIEKNHMKTASSRTQSALGKVKSIDTFGDVAAVSHSLENAMEHINAKNITDAVQSLDIASQNLNAMFMSAPDKIIELDEMFNEVKTALKNKTLNPDMLIPLKDKLSFFHAVTNMLFAKVHMDAAVEMHQKNKVNHAMKEIRAARNAIYKVMLNCSSGELKQALKNLHDNIMVLSPANAQEPAFGEKLQNLNIQVHNTSISEL